MITKSRPKTIIAKCHSRKERALDPRVRFFVGYLQIFYILRSLHTKKMTITLWFSIVHNSWSRHSSG